MLIVEDESCELITEWEGPDLEIGQTIVVTEMDTTDNKIACRVLDIHHDHARVEIIQGRLIAIDKHDDDWPLSGQPPGYFAEPTEPDPKSGSPNRARSPSLNGTNRTMSDMEQVMKTKPRVVLGVIYLEAEHQCRPSGKKIYHYFVPGYITHEFKPQDMAVVMGGDRRLCLVRVEEVLLDPPEHRATKPIVGTVDVSGYCREQERTKRRAEVIAALQRLDEQRLERARFAELAKGDAEAARLVQELEQLDAA